MISSSFYSHLTNFAQQNTKNSSAFYLTFFTLNVGKFLSNCSHFPWNCPLCGPIKKVRKLLTFLSIRIHRKLTSIKFESCLFLVFTDRNTINVKKACTMKECWCNFLRDELQYLYCSKLRNYHLFFCEFFDGFNPIKRLIILLWSNHLKSMHNLLLIIDKSLMTVRENFINIFLIIWEKV